MGKEGIIKLRFLFANHDGVYKTLEFPLDTTLQTVKEEVLTEWPEPLDAPEAVTRFRLLCMGKELEATTSKTLRHLNIPSYDTHPTPVNVSILPKGFKTPSASKAKVSGANAPTAQACCIVM